MTALSWSSKQYGVWMWILLGFFCFRVSAQLIQAIQPVGFLPPFAAWQSGLLPYPFLVFSQFLIILFLGRTALRFSQKQIQAQAKTARVLLSLGSIYALAMIIRYIIRMSVFPQERWFGGCLPIFFHLILASFLLIWGHYHLSRTLSSKPGRARPQEQMDEFGPDPVL